MVVSGESLVICDYELLPLFNSSQLELDLFCHEVPHIMIRGISLALGMDDLRWSAWIPFNPWALQSRFTRSFSHEISQKYWTRLCNMKIVDRYPEISTLSLSPAHWSGFIALQVIGSIIDCLSLIWHFSHEWPESILLAFFEEIGASHYGIESLQWLVGGLLGSWNGSQFHNPKEFSGLDQQLEHRLEIWITWVLNGKMNLVCSCSNATA